MTNFTNTTTNSSTTTTSTTSTNISSRGCPSSRNSTINNNLSPPPSSSLSPKSNSSSGGGGSGNNSKPTLLFKGEFKNYKVREKPKRMTKSILTKQQLNKNKSTMMIDQQPILQVNPPPRPIPIVQKKESIMSQLTFHESYSKDMCPFGSVKVKNNPVRNHPYVQQFVLNSSQSTSSVASNQHSKCQTSPPPLPTLLPSTQDKVSLLPKTIPQRENQNFQIFHFKVGLQAGVSGVENSTHPPLLPMFQRQASFNSPSSCSSTNTTNTTTSSTSMTSCVHHQQGSSTMISSSFNRCGGIPKPILMEALHHEHSVVDTPLTTSRAEEMIILPPFRQVSEEQLENIRIPSIKYIESLIHNKPHVMSNNNKKIYS